MNTSATSASKTGAALDWFATARYGLFIHYGLYSLLGRGEWALNRERIPLDEYKALASRFTAEKFDADEICDMAVRWGMRYIIFTTMHHDGFCLYETELTDFNSVKACGRDLTAEIIEAARKRGLKIALYHSLNNWTSEPDGVQALEDEAAYEVFIAATFERIRDLVTRYNPVDVLWYDGTWPFHDGRWQGEKMNEMVRSIQPDILFTGRNGLAGDFATPEQHLTAPSPWQPWEACITLNGSWGFHVGDHDWKTPGTVVDMLAEVANGGGNLALNVGPQGDGSFPPAAVEILDAVGQWLGRNGECIYGTDRFTWSLSEGDADGTHRSDWSMLGVFTAKGNNLYLLARHWPGSELTIAGLQCEVKNVRLVGSGESFPFVQREGRVVVSGLPEAERDALCPVICFECDGPPAMYLCGGMRTPKVPHPHY